VTSKNICLTCSNASHIIDSSELLLVSVTPQEGVTSNSVHVRFRTQCGALSVHHFQYSGGCFKNTDVL